MSDAADKAKDAATGAMNTMKQKATDAAHGAMDNAKDAVSKP
jgi:hypothetical protein